jgi:regulator of replication initiation timing
VLLKRDPCDLLVRVEVEDDDLLNLYREIDRLRRELEKSERARERLKRENEQLKKELAATRRAGKRQAAPFSKGAPKPNPAAGWTACGSLTRPPRSSSGASQHR